VIVVYRRYPVGLGPVTDVRLPLLDAIDRLHPEALVRFDAVVSRIDVSQIRVVASLIAEWRGVRTIGEITPARSSSGGFYYSPLIFWRFVRDRRGQHLWIPIDEMSGDLNTPEYQKVYYGQ